MINRYGLAVGRPFVGAMSSDEIIEVIEAFATAAERAQTLGFDVGMLRIQGLLVHHTGTNIVLFLECAPNHFELDSVCILGMWILLML